MSAITAPTTDVPPTLPVLEDVGKVSFLRLVAIELRKSVNTRAGMWLMIVMAGISLVVVGAFAIWGPDEGRTFATFLGLTGTPLMMLLPIVGIMLATQEWSTRTGLVTFTLEPRRGLVVAAKLVASIVLGLLVLAAAFVAAGLVTTLVGGQWSLAGVSVGGMVLAMVIFVLQGAGFGLAFLNTPFAIVASLVLPTAWTIAIGLITALRDVAPWLNLEQPVGLLLSGAGMTGENWAQLGTASLVWVGLPIAVGTWRVLTREVK
ncbi:ABC transporter permease [Janibacter cremeus]|uniref:ABC-type transport system involved in multi-copper enzyme maturation permease subunit n=1 Tax=Janibacter cremeus TaxID=1285192 RepID=A0A852VZC6_9MICO|nr:ABC transporter permease [Janibacter cremeus]NYF99544.1 ABC-type transport system involved in multi-copper enzyme maturation permease subunit [Janibacter cremeus]